MSVYVANIVAFAILLTNCATIQRSQIIQEKLSRIGFKREAGETALNRGLKEFQ